jgi:hypothetical protein
MELYAMQQAANRALCTDDEHRRMTVHGQNQSLNPTWAPASLDHA